MLLIEEKTNQEEDPDFYHEEHEEHEDFLNIIFVLFVFFVVKIRVFFLVKILSHYYL